MDPLELLRKYGYKLTRPRLAVIKCLQKATAPQTADDIHTSLKRSHINLTSVYRTLELLDRMGIAFCEERTGERWYYLAEKQHHHIICRKCHRTECVPCRMEFKSPAGFKHIEHQLILTGLCKKCTY